MLEFKLHDRSSAPEPARETLGQVQKKFGFITNLIAVMAEAPPLTDACLALSQLLEQTSFNPAERLILLLAASEANGCDYGVAAHTMGAHRAKVPEAVITAPRANKPLPDVKLETLHRLTHSMVIDRGRPDAALVEAFPGAGYTRRNLLEVILAVGMKTLSNYPNPMAETPLDAAFEPAAWHRRAADRWRVEKRARACRRPGLIWSRSELVLPRPFARQALSNHSQVAGGRAGSRWAQALRGTNHE